MNLKKEMVNAGTMRIKKAVSGANDALNNYILSPEQRLDSAIDALNDILDLLDLDSTKDDER